jgi:hypothetical protein
VNGGRERLRGGGDGSGSGYSAGSGTPGKRTLTQFLRRREGQPATGADDALEATRGARISEGAADRASGRALERSQAESIHDERATLTLDSELLSEGERRRAARRNPRLQQRLGWEATAFSTEPIDSDEFALEVARLQEREGLRVDGICGPRTCDAAGVPLRKRSHGPREAPAADATNAAFEAARGARIAEGAADRAWGRALERPQAESIDDERATLDLDADDDADRTQVAAGHVVQRQATASAPAPATSTRGPTLKEVVQRRRAAESAPPPPPAPVASRPLGRRLDLGLPIQKRTAASDSEPSTEQIHETATAGVATPVQELPHRAALEASFGSELSDVHAHVGGDAEHSAQAIGAEAYASGDHVVLPSSPSLHTVAHEVAHVFQQRGGDVRLKGGVGEAGDPYEVEADAVADAVVRGEHVNVATGEGNGDAAVQRREVDAEAGGVPTDLPAGFEVLVTATLDMNVPEGDLKLAQTRAKLLRAQFRALHRPHRRTLLGRLDPPRKGDTLAGLFQGKLSTAERGRLLAVLRDETPAATEEAEPAVAEASTANAAASGEATIAAHGLAPTATATGTEEAILQSSDPSVNGRAVADVGAELHGKAANYGRFPAQQQEYASYNLKNEKRILDDHDGVFGTVVNLFGDAVPPNPERWRKAVVDWGTVQTQLQAVLALQPTAANIHLMGELTEKGLTGWQAAMVQTSAYSDEMLRYLQEFSRIAGAINTGVQITADVAMAAAITCAVIVTGPAILAVGAQLATAAGATGATALVVKGTTALVGAGLVGSATRGGLQFTRAAGYESIDVLVEYSRTEKSLREAADVFDWSSVGDQTWDGVKKGFVDGVFARGGLAIEAAATRFVGAAVAKYLGPYAGKLYAQVLRRAAERAITAGVAGAIGGGLDSGARAALEGKSLPQILAAMEYGAKLGGAAGAVFGGASGAIDQKRAARAAAAADDVAPTSTVPDTAPPPAPARHMPDVEQLSPDRYRPDAGGMLDGTMEKHRLVDAETGQKYLFKPNRADAPIPDRAVEHGVTPDTIANRAKASEVAAQQFDIDTPEVKIVEYDGQVGSLQEWRATGNTYRLKDLEFEHPDLWAKVKDSPEFARHRADLDTFDYVLNNLDRNGGNLFVRLDDNGKVIGFTAIDHDLTFTRTVDRFVDTGSWARGLPDRYSREMVAKLRTIAANPDGFRNVLRPYLDPAEIEASITRVQRILDDVDAKVATRGETAVFADGEAAPAATPSPAVEAASTLESSKATAGPTEMFMARPPLERTFEHALNPQTYIDDVAKHYGINLRGVKAVFDPDLPPGQLGVTREVEGGLIIRIGRDAFVDQPTLANTIAHELSHARDFMRGVHKPHGDLSSMTDGTVYGSGNALEDWIRRSDGGGQ